MLVAVAAEVMRGKKGRPAIGRIRLAEISDFRKITLHGFLAGNVGDGAALRTDGWAA